VQSVPSDRLPAQLHLLPVYELHHFKCPQKSMSYLFVESRLLSGLTYLRGLERGPASYQTASGPCVCPGLPVPPWAGPSWPVTVGGQGQRCS
jgi:hypothetical protein